MNRISYAVFLAAIAAAYIVMISVLHVKRPPGAEIIVGLIVIPRLHDVGRSGWWLLILLAAEIAAIVIGWQSGAEGILIAGGFFVFAALGAFIVLGFVPGQPHTNQWGGPPSMGVNFGRRTASVETSTEAPTETSASTLPIVAFVLAALLTVGSATYFLGQNRGSEPDPDAVAVVPGGTLQRSDFRVLVQGWNEDELRRILSDFCRKYDLNAETFKVSPTGGSLLAVRTTDGLDADQFFYLVNYLNYPESFDLTHRKLSVLGLLNLSRETGLPADAKPGERAWIYMPENDRDYDLAYLRRKDGQTYRISFTNMAWRPVSDPREPAGVQALRDRSGGLPPS